MRTKVDYSAELEKLYSELEQVESMAELEACEFCGADSKDEALEAIQCEIDYYEDALREEEQEDSFGLDPAFSSWAEVNRMFI